MARLLTAAIVWTAMNLVYPSYANAQEKSIQNISDRVSECIRSESKKLYAPEDVISYCENKERTLNSLMCFDALVSNGVSEKQALSDCWVPSSVKLSSPAYCICLEVTEKIVGIQETEQSNDTEQELDTSLDIDFPIS